MAQQAHRKKASQGAPEQQVTEVPVETPAERSGPGRLSPRGRLVLAGVVVLLNLPVLHMLVRGTPEAGVPVPYADDFSDPTTVQQRYFNTGGLWRVERGELHSPGVRNNPLWLKASLPADVAIEFDVRSESPEGDIKVEVFGDGRNHASGYVLIHGGWNNSLSIIARLDEHGRSLKALEADALRIARAQALPRADLLNTGVFTERTHMRVEANPFPVQQSRTYHWRIERRGGRIAWSIDGQPFMSFDDPLPLRGAGHDRFGFSSWNAELYFDNLKVTPL
ncbi:MAG: hypothetical protein L0Y66_13600 [Myxococcaceae bacterium]|nr:hypothetical protein [Myxococcaceae bacterium]MCI0668841.1 hypothetical protein [Myxococcaceae bacterium]